MEYRKASSISSSNERLYGAKHVNPIQVMDSALYFIHNIIDLNIDMLELIIEIRKKLVQKERFALNLLHHCIKKAETLRLQFGDNLQQFCSVEQSGIVGHELYERFNGRVSEKVFKKFLFYSMNSKSLQFTTENLIELYQLNKEHTEGGSRNMHSFRYMSKVVQFVLEENRSLINLLLELIVDENYVSSLDEFFILKGIRRIQRNDVTVFEQTGKVIDPYDVQSSSEEEFSNPLCSRAEERTKRKTKKQNNKHRKGQFFREDFKNQLDTLLLKYQDVRIRQDFLAVLSKSIRKEFEVLTNNSEQQIIYKRFRLQRHRSNERWMEQNRNNSKGNTQVLENSICKEESLKKQKSDQEFFVSTHTGSLIGKKTPPETIVAKLASASPRKESRLQTKEPLELLEQLEKWKPQTGGDAKRATGARKSTEHTSTSTRIKVFTATRSRVSAKPNKRGLSVNRRKQRQQFRQYFEQMMADDATSRVPRRQGANSAQLPRQGSLMLIPRNIDRYVERFEADLEDAVETLIQDESNPLRKPNNCINDSTNTNLILNHLNRKLRSRNVKSAEPCRINIKQHAKISTQTEEINNVTTAGVVTNEQTNDHSRCQASTLNRLRLLLSGFSHPSTSKPIEAKPYLKPQIAVSSCRRLVKLHHRHWRELYHTSLRQIIPPTVK